MAKSKKIKFKCYVCGKNFEDYENDNEFHICSVSCGIKGLSKLMDRINPNRIVEREYSRELTKEDVEYIEKNMAVHQVKDIATHLNCSLGKVVSAIAKIKKKKSSQAATKRGQAK